MATPRPTGPGSDRLVRLQIFAAFVVPLALVIIWLGSRGFFSTP